MAEQSAFLKAYDDMQKKKGGFNAPAPLESVVDTVGQAPAVQSPFSSASAAKLNPIFNAPQVDSSKVGNNNFGGFMGQGDTEFLNEMQSVGVPQELQTGFFNAMASGARINPQSGTLSTFGGIRQGPTLANEARLDTLAPAVQEPQADASAEVAGDPNTLGAQAPAVVAASPAEATPEVMGTPESIAGLSVNGTDVVTPEAITEAGPVAPQAQLPSTIQNANGQDLMGFKPKYEGQSLTDYMAGRDDPSAASVQVQDPQGRFRRQAASVAGETPEQNQARTDALFPEQADFEQASADREARQAARPDFGTAVSDRDRRAARGEGISDADRRDIAKANRQGASAGDVARGAKVAAANGIDPKTGKAIEGKSTVAEDRLAFDKKKYADIQAKEAKGVPLTPSEQLQKERFEYLKAKDEETKAAKTTPEQIEKDRLAEEAAVLNNERKRQVIAKGNEPDATSMQKKKGEWEEMKEDMVENNMPEDEIAARRKAFLYGDKFDEFRYGGGTSNKGKAADEVEMTDAKGIRRLVPAKDKEEAIKNGYTLV